MLIINTEVTQFAIEGYRNHFFYLTLFLGVLKISEFKFHCTKMVVISQRAEC